MKNLVNRSREFNLLITFVVALSGLVPIPAHAVTVSFNCPTGGGTYQVVDGTVPAFGISGTCGGDLVLDSSVTTLANYAFFYAAITSLTIPATVTTITGVPIADAKNLISVVVDDANPNYASVDGVLFDKALTNLIVYPVSKTGSTYSIPGSVTSIGIYSFSYNKFLTSISIPNSVTTMSGQVFLESNALTTISIGSGLSSVGDQSFADIRTLTAINVDASNTSFASIDGVLYSKDISKLWAYPVGKTGTSYVAPNTVTSTAYTVFGSSTKLLIVDLSSVTTLSGQEFRNATSVREVTFGNSLVNLKSQVLQRASGLRKLTLGTGLTTITDSPFYGNTLLYCVIYPGTNSTIQNYAYPNSVVPVASAADCLADPAFTISSSSEAAIASTPITGYTVASTGGTIASFSISPAISNTPGLSFSTLTGLISGTPTTVASARTYTITATNAANTATRTFAITINPVAPAFTISSSSEAAISSTPITGYTIASTGGTIASFSISPAISNTPGLAFSTSTGQISGTATAAASSRTYTITATNATSTATRDFSITVTNPVPVVVYVPPAPVLAPYLKTLISPRIGTDPTQFICHPGRYNFGYTLDGVNQGSSTSNYKPPYPYTFKLIINGVLQSLDAKPGFQGIGVWDLSSAPSGSIVSCSVTVKVNDLINTDKSTDLSEENKPKFSQASSQLNQSLREANASYMVMSLINSNTYVDTLDSNRANWRAAAVSIPAAYRAELARIKTLTPTRETRALATALRKNYMVALKKNSADYKASGPAALAAKGAANKLALDQKNNWIAAANANYGTFIESIGYGVLIP
jgi:hypothetical protein